MGFINKRAILISAAIGVALYFISEPFFGGGFIDYKDRLQEAPKFGFGAFIICAVALHIKPELMGKLNKSDEDDNEEEKPSD